jgi:hypothetical protein
MSRKSAAANVVPLRQAPRLRPPDDLTADQREIWLRTVNSLPAAHFHATDGPLLRSYVQASARVLEAGQRLQRGAVRASKPSPWFGVWERAWRLQLALSRTLRLAPSARRDRTTAGADARADLRAPVWADGGQNDD